MMKGTAARGNKLYFSFGDSRMPQTGWTPTGGVTKPMGQIDHHDDAEMLVWDQRLFLTPEAAELA